MSFDIEVAGKAARDHTDLGFDCLDKDGYNGTMVQRHNDTKAHYHDDAM